MNARRSYYSSSSFKMAALFTLLLGASALLLGYYLRDYSHRIYTEETEAAIDIEIEHILVAFDGLPLEERVAYIKARSAKFKNPIYYYQNRDDERLAGNIARLPLKVVPISAGIISFHLPLDERQQTFGAKVHTFADGSRLLIGRNIDEITSRYDRLKLISFLILLFMLAVVLVSFFISTFVVSRINMISQTAQNIMTTGDLSQRISIDSNWDDLSNLAQTLNAMLARIEDLLIGIRDVSDNIAHDLRTPLARVRSQLEGALRKPMGEADIDELLKETDDLLATFNALLSISHIEKGSQRFAFQAVEPIKLIRDVVELYEPLAEERGIRITARLAASGPLEANGPLLSQMIANILDNAVKYSPAGSEVLISLEDRAGHKLIRIADEGVGIDPAERDKVFDRFYRSDKSRHSEGNGLGLSLVKAALALHKGEIRLEDNRPGLIVEISLPERQARRQAAL